jgi:DNA-binding SARP family transcriptional activator
MYVRAFPEVLGMLAAAVGVDRLPARLLALLPLDTLERSSASADVSMPSEVAADFRERLAGFVHTAAKRESGASGIDSAPPEINAGGRAYVRVLGGLEVTTPAGEVDGAAWRKRKARLLLVMLVLHRGRDVSRDVILERLWPDMDYDHARNNFYVMWSTVKRALSACGEAGTFIQNSGGLCRATSLVRSDLDDLYAAIDDLRSGIDSGSVSAVARAARTLMDLYRGDVLPGDVYDDWISEVRTQVRQDFCDAMLRAARYCDTSGEHEVAVQFARRAVAADPWREDAYQVLMRSHLGAGQRSRAIEAYLACRTRLVEDLGIDPCADTTQIYQAVLAMEDSVPDYRAAQSEHEWLSHGSYPV